MGGLRLQQLALLALACGLAACRIDLRPPPAPADERRRPPNILVFLVDDLGWQDTSEPFHTERTPLNERYRTPNVERLAARGVKFTNAYAAAPVCTPTRASLMTGRSPARSHITYWTLQEDRDSSARHPQLRPPAWNVNGLSAEDTTLPGLLRDAGYRTIHVGKAHFGAVGTSGARPTRLGFDINVAGHGAGAPGSYYGVHAFSAALRSGGDRIWDVPGLEAYHGEDVFLTEALSREAEKVLRAAVADEKPFYLSFAPYAVHTPIQANERYLDHYADLDPREAAYATLVESVDVALGELLDLLDELGVSEETIVVYTSDNGGLSAVARGGEAHVHNAPLASGKGSAYEGGLRVPQIVAWPGRTDAPSICETPVITYDLFPSLLAWAGVALPAHLARELDGVDLSPCLAPAPGRDGPGRDEPAAGATSALAPRDLFWHQPHFWGVDGPGIWPFTAMRSGDWKLIYRHADRGMELYDLAADLGETRDLALAQPERVARMAEGMSAWCERVGAQMSIDVVTDRPVELPRERLPLRRD